MDDFFRPASLATLAGCITAVVVIMNTIRHVFDWGPRWFALLLALAIAVAAYSIASHLGEESQTKSLPWAARALIILLNGCLIYTSAFGIQNTTIAEQPQGFWMTGPPAPGPLTFRSPW